MITTAALSEADKSAWCRAQGIYLVELEPLCASATTALAEPQDARASPQATHIAAAARQVWCWDMTYLPATVIGRWFHLYLILDLHSRKIVGWEVHADDSSDHAVHLLRRTALAEGIAALADKPVLGF